MGIVKVRRGNVVLRVPQEQVKAYVNQGFDAYNENGQLIQRAMLNDVATLQNLLAQSEAKVAELEAEVAKLRAEIAEVKAEASQEVEQPEEAEKKTTKRRSVKS